MPMEKKYERSKIWKEANKRIRKEYNSNFYWDCVGWTERVWLNTLCDVFQEKIDTLEKELKERVII